LKKELDRLKEQSINKNIILLGQTMGPFTENRGELARESLKNTKIYTRDDKCLEYLSKLNFINIDPGRDLAFSELPMQSIAKSILKKYNIDKGEYITVVPSGLTECYTKNFEKYIEEQVSITKKILSNVKLSDKKIVLLPHVLIPAHVDDRLIIREIINRLDEKSKIRIIAIDDAMLPSEAREILGDGIFTITGRMHAAVSTFYMKKPAISLSYSVKYAGVIGDGLDMNELVIESANEKLWISGEISKLVDEKVNYVFDNYNELVKKIDIKVSETSKIVEEELDDVINEIKKIKG
jgi:colanic acid/amylovoran biosynthesis protein